MEAEEGGLACQAGLTRMFRSEGRIVLKPEASAYDRFETSWCQTRSARLERRLSGALRPIDLDATFY
jgi:hypothetical protein